MSDSKIQRTGCLNRNDPGKSMWGSRCEHPLYLTWCRMRERCTNPKHQAYRHYGGKGVKMCDRWQDFGIFVQDMGERPTPKHTVDRKDTNGDYCPENCKWSTIVEQNNNRSNSMWLTLGPVTLTARQWEQERGFPNGAIFNRKRAGWSDYDAIMKPIRKKAPNSSSKCAA